MAVRSSPRRALGGTLWMALVLIAVLVPIASARAEAPQVTIESPHDGSVTSSPTPSFAGTTNDPIDEVVLTIYTESGAPLPPTSVLPEGGSWSAGPAQPLRDGVYSAQASQTNLAMESGSSQPPVSFTVDTPPPTVTLQQPPSPSNNTAPSFTGTASDTTPVVVHVYHEGTEVSSATAGGTGGSWTSSAAGPSLGAGTYTAIAKQTSSLGKLGESAPVTFTVQTAAPVVTLVQPKSPSNITRPTFTGTASDSTPVVVHVFDAAEHEVATATSPHGGSWVSGTTSSTLAAGRYSAVATQNSSLGNPAGESARAFFEVVTSPPAVTIDQPLAHSNNAKPTFTGTASDTKVVKVQVFLGTKATGTSLATVTAFPSGGTWASGRATLLGGKHTYTAIATQESSLGNPTGTSAPVTFAVDTEAPAVVLNAPPSPTNDATPSFTGTASETNPVTVEIYAGSKISGSPVARALANGTGGGWATGPASPALPDGEYVAVATQNSSYGHEPGGYGPDPFVIDTVPPRVTLSRPSDGASTSGSTQAVEGSAGTAAGDDAAVSVQLFSGTQIAGGQAPVQSVRVPVNGAAWSVTLAGLGPGAYVVRAEQTDTAGNVGMSAGVGFSVAGSPLGAPAAGPTASFSWSPSAPHAGEKVSLLSSSTDPASPLVGFAWDILGTGAFVQGGPLDSAIFTSAGKHPVSLRIVDARGATSVAAETINVAGPASRLMQPFPTVKITATRVGAGVRLRLLSIRAAAGARVAVTCSGKGCPVKSQSRVATAGKAGAPPLEFRRFEHFLRPGVVLEMRIVKAGEIGKYTRFAVRRGRLPTRTDACVGSATGKPIPCPL